MTPIPPSITTGISNYEETGYGDPVHKMKALTWQAPNQVKLGKNGTDFPVLMNGN